jgi:uncharacterized surface protein with fasciclin (FAS1) repeats
MHRLIASAALAAAGVVGLAAPAAAAPSAIPDLVETAAAANGATGDFDTLLAALEATGLADALSAKGQRTVFAPTDDAFAELGLTPANVGTLPNDVLVDVLLYHVTPGRKYAADVLAADGYRMANCERADIVGATIDAAPIVATDIEARNGVIHVIDRVMTPSVLG